MGSLTSTTRRRARRVAFVAAAAVGLWAAGQSIGIAVFLGLALCALSVSAAEYTVCDHPRIFVNPQGLQTLAEHATGPHSAEYGLIKLEADRAVTERVRPLDSRWRTPTDLICLGLTYLVERERGRPADRYADAVKSCWGNGDVLSLDGSGHFGYHAMVYDWIHDAMSPEERVLYGNALGQWLRWYTDEPEILLKNGHWWYNQTWAPAHLNTPNTRDGLTPKLFTALAIRGAGTRHDSDARRFLDSWAKRVPAECIPAFDEMGGVWSESMGHGNYGPVAVIPWAFEAWRTATGQDLFQLGGPASYPRAMTRWAVHLRVPFSGTTAWIDDNQAADLRGYARVAPILAARYSDPVANGISDESMSSGWHRVPWNRFLSHPAAAPSGTPQSEGYPTAEHFRESGHVYMRGDWGDPNATWAFFGAGPKFAGHSRDDEGSFLIARKGHLVLRAGGQGHNDWDYYAGGSLAFNIVTVYDPDEEFRRTSPGSRWFEREGVKNENDGGLIRHVYSRHTRSDRAKVTAYQHDDRLTYAAADLTEGYRAHKVREITRQFLYLRGEREFFVVFDRVEATSAAFPKTWFLHMPGEPLVQGPETVHVPGHVHTYRGDTATWLSDPAGENQVLSTGRSRAFLKVLLPSDAAIVKRGGPGHERWGHPHNPEAQYNHAGRRSDRPPIVPWRLEVEGPGGEEREYFLHVLEIGDEDDARMSEVTLVERDGHLGAMMDAGGSALQVLFAAEGPLAARLKVGAGPEEDLATSTE